VRQRPGVFTSAFKRAGRERKILVDYLRNNRTNTSIAAFSTRARPGAPVSMPVAWSELTRTAPDRFTIRTVPGRVEARRDPWREYWTTRQTLSAAAVRALTRL
jgi:bifunctional non-homologous end joining protein LigD